MPGDMFPNIDKIGYARCPVYIVHGTKDEIVPLWHGQELYRKTKDEFKYPPFWIEGGGHNNLEIMARNPFYERFRQFLAYLEKTPIPQELKDMAANSPI
mmetsp:Transcript_11939/g.25767  ORF Transcript_11939/g.25767 Transcript_11939/m.25767 type:complete len:99 (-) Transcript_11939:160-456(-)